MKNRSHSIIESSYRTYHGKLFASLLSRFGAGCVPQIEDAIQNSFYKSLKSWKPGQIPDNKENWLYIVARNDVINQLKKDSRTQSSCPAGDRGDDKVVVEDLRLQTIMFLSQFKNVSSQAKVLFVLKNIFGLSIREISESTLLTQDAIYKSVNRTKRSFQQGLEKKTLHRTFDAVTENEIALVEEFLYAVFNIGFDSFNVKTESVVDEDLCLEALAIARLLLKKFGRTSSGNLIALFCFHVARIPAKVENGRLISFFDQDKKKWKSEFISLGFHYLTKPAALNKYYVEALIASKYMVTRQFNTEQWNEIIKLYELLTKLSNSSIVKLNLCYCLHKAQKTDKALNLLNAIESELPGEHVYFSLVKANIIKETDGPASDRMMFNVLNKIDQKIRKDHLMKNMGF